MTADYPQIWFLGFVVLAIVTGMGWPHGPGWLIWPGGLLMGAGTALMGAAVIAMRRARTTVDPYGRPAALVVSGVFALSRNPIYLGNALLLTGLCLVMRAPFAVIVLVPAFVLVISSRFIPREEARLRASFPREFSDYSARTRRWL